MKELNTETGRVLQVWQGASCKISKIFEEQLYEKKQNLFWSRSPVFRPYWKNLEQFRIYFIMNFTINKSEAPGKRWMRGQINPEIWTYLVEIFVAKWWAKRANTSMGQHWQNGCLRVKVLRTNNFFNSWKDQFFVVKWCLW